MSTPEIPAGIMARDAGLKLAFFASPDESIWTPSDIASVTGYEESHLTTARSRGGGPKFLKAGRKIWYRKRDVMRWISEISVEASNTAEAEEKKLKRAA